MVALGTLLVIVLLSLLVTRLATTALVATGMTKHYAKFQARSALTGVGFTTSEAESVVNHPVRRRIVMWLMLVGNAGIVSVAATLIIGFDTSDDAAQAAQRLGLLIGGLLVIWIVASNAMVERVISRGMSHVLARLTDIEVRDYAGLLHVAGDYTVAELMVEDHDWMCHKMVRDLGLEREGITLLGLERRGSYVGTPARSTELAPGDLLLLYGRRDVIEDLDRRPRGEQGHEAHMRSAQEQTRIAEEEHEKAQLGSYHDAPGGSSRSADAGPQVPRA